MKRFLLQGWYSNKFLLGGMALLFLIAYVLNRYVISTTSAAFYSSRIQNTIERKEKDALKLLEQTEFLTRLAQGNYTQEELDALVEEEKGYALFISLYHSSGLQQLVFWNTHSLDPPSQRMTEDSKGGLLFLKNGYYLHRYTDLEVEEKRYRVQVLIPIMYKYFVELENLQTAFAGVPEAIRFVSFVPGEGTFPVRTADGSVLFSLEAKNTETRQPNWWIFALMATGVVFLLQFLRIGSDRIIQRYGRWAGILALVVAVAALRTILYIQPGLFQLRQFHLFDPAIYSSGKLLQSLGDLAINVFLLNWLALFVTRRAGTLPDSGNYSVVLRWLFGSGALGMLVWSAFAYAGVLQSMVADAKISFNVTNFFSLDLFSFVGFLVLAALGYSFYLMGQFMIRVVKAYLPLQPFSAYVFTGTLGLLILSLTRDTSLIELNLPVLIWLLLFIALQERREFRLLQNQRSVAGFLFWLFFFSSSMAGVIVYENGKIEAQQRRVFAEKLSLQADPSNERILSIALTYLDNDFLAPNFERFRDQELNPFLKDSIIDKNFSTFLNQYDTRVYTFEGGASPQALYNEDAVSFDTLNTIFNVLGRETSIEGLRYFEQSFDKYSYIFRKEVRSVADGSTLGYFFIIAEPRRYKQDALVPALFKQGRESLLPEFSGYYAYGIYAEGELVDHFNEYPFATSIQSGDLPRSEFEIRRKDGFDELWYRKSRDNVVVIARKSNALLEAITLFAYLFSTFLLLFAVNWLGTVLIRSRLQWSLLKEYFRFSIRNQIHSTIILISLLSFVVIGAVTILFFINRYDRTNQDRLSRTMQIMVKQVERKLQEDPFYFESNALYRNSRNIELEELVRETSEIHGADVNLYDPEGFLRVTSRPLIYTRGVLGQHMHPAAWYTMHHREAIQFISQEGMGKVNYLSIYNPVRNQKGKVVAYLNVPSYSTEKELKQEISNFLVTLINLNAFIFLVAGVIALYITNRITRSFTLIGQKMQDMNLGKSNQEIIWKRNDEIGGLVREYNKMVQKLDESASNLAKSEREGAWRQMARQVAHEIKNPLTPMKLSIQYLQKAIDNNDVDVKKMTANVANTLVEQIDHLNKIASDFSQFANIGNPKNERFDLHEVMHSMALLHEANEQIEFMWVPCKNPLMVMADRTQLNRLFTNLIQNAIEATSSRPLRRITVKEECTDKEVIVSVEDNGTGIAEHTRARIFTPNFTTKTSGTGLGLAMSKSIIENVKGEIWFDTVPGEGSVFHVKIPLYSPSSQPQEA